MIDYYYYSPNGEDKKPTLEEIKKPRSKRRRYKIIAVMVLSLFLILGTLAAGTYLYVTNTPLRSADGRTNIVILGVDSVAKLSDTIILVSIDHKNKQEPKVAMISVPRDLYLEVPEYGFHKVNSAYSLGEQAKEGDGPTLTLETLATNFDVPVHYYAVLEFKGFERIVDAIGGVKVEVKTDINDPFYPAPNYNGYNPFSIKKGTRLLDGKTALKYARSRQTTNDFDRAFRQQQIVLAVRDKLLSKEVFLDYYTITTLVDVLETNVHTDLSRPQMLRLADTLRNLKHEDTRQYVLDTSNFLTPVFNETGSALIPRVGDFSEIRQFIDNVFTQTEVGQFEQSQF